MDAADLRLSEIETLWSVVRRAHDGAGNSLRSAQQTLLDRYGRAIRRYLLGALRSEEAADDLYQEFSVKFLSGAFAGADPARGRFRSFVKSSIFRMVVDHQRRQQRQARVQPLPADELPGAAGDELLAEQERAFAQSWRQELLARCWESLSRLERDTKRPYHTTLRFRADHPDLNSAQLAEALAQQTGQQLTAGNVRVMLHRAREKFSDLLLDAVQETLADPTRDQLEEELIELDLIGYCRPALDRRRGG